VGVIRRAAFTGLSSVNVINSFQKTGTWPINPSIVTVDRLVQGMGALNAVRTVDLKQLALRLGPEARHNMREPAISFGSISTRGRAIESTNDAMLEAMDELVAIAAGKQAAKDNFQGSKSTWAAESIAQVARDEVVAEQRRYNAAVVARTEGLRRRAARARAAAGPVALSSFDRDTACNPAEVTLVQSFHNKPSTPAGSIVPSTSHMCVFCDATLSILDRRSRNSLKRDQSRIPGDAQRSRGTLS